ncbi:capsule assembly Wzi family protein [Aliikangiella sp. IMCC44632]
MPVLSGANWFSFDFIRLIFGVKKTERKLIGLCLVVCTTVCSVNSGLLNAAPWLNTQDQYLRADIETLADIGIVKSPLTTYPLMWSNIVRDLDQTNIEQVAPEYKAIYWRVKNAARVALSGKTKRTLRVSASNSEQVFRSFGDDARGRAELNASNEGLNKWLAWNLEVTRLYKGYDGESTLYDGSYISAVLNNWSITAGAIEKWWGPSWQSANLLSNNARPQLGLSIQRNYANAFELPLVKWLGPWTLAGFVSKAESTRKYQKNLGYYNGMVKDQKLAGMSFSFKPHSTLELSLRASTLWGGNAFTNLDENGIAHYAPLTESVSSLLDSLLANQQCEQSDGANLLGRCEDGSASSGDRIAGIDLRWNLPISYPISLYASQYGESDSQLILSKNINQYGVTSSFEVANTHWRWFAEVTNTSLGNTLMSVAYESESYPEGFRINQRNIGSTYDNDSKVTSLGLIGRLSRYQQLSFSVSDILLNKDSMDYSSVAEHSITPTSSELKHIKLNWRYQTRDMGEFDVSLEQVNKKFDRYNRFKDKLRLAIDWRYVLN